MSILDKFKSFVENAAEQAQPFSPSTLDDDVASKTAWDPLLNSGSNYRSFNLSQISPKKLVYKPTLMRYLFPIIFGGAFVIAGIMVIHSFSDKLGSFTYPLMAALAIISLSLGFWVMRKMLKNRVIDTSLGFFYKGNEPAGRDYNISGANHCRLKQVHAIQLVKHYFQKSSSDTSGSSYYNYELNFVLNDASRINVIASNTSSQARTDAAKISKMLDIPVWDAL